MQRWGQPPETEAERAYQLNGRAQRMSPAMQRAQPVETFEGEGERHHQPADQHAVGVMATDVFQTVAILGIVEALVFDLLAALGHPE